MMKDAEKLALQQALDRVKVLLANIVLMTDAKNAHWPPVCCRDIWTLTTQELERLDVEKLALQQALDRVKVLLANIVLMTDAKNVHWPPVCCRDIWTLTTQELERLTDDR
jgi:cytidine deaminase